MKNIINFNKLSFSIEVLRFIKTYIDPNAFIAGGYAFDIINQTDLTQDIDIFFKSPNFEIFDKTSVKLIEKLLETKNNLKFKSSKFEVYYYHKSILNLGSIFSSGFLKVDLIQYKSNLTPNQVIDTFDLDICKVMLDISGSNNVYGIKSDKYIDALNKWSLKKELTAHYDMFENDLVNKIQNQKTEQRYNKWLNRLKKLD